MVYRSLLLGKVFKSTSMDGSQRGSIARGSIDHPWHFVVSVFYESRKRHLSLPTQNAGDVNSFSYSVFVWIPCTSKPDFAGELCSCVFHNVKRQDKDRMDRLHQIAAIETPLLHLLL